MKRAGLIVAILSTILVGLGVLRARGRALEATAGQDGRETLTVGFMPVT